MRARWGQGHLLFVARGSVRHGSFEEGKPWEHLRSFSVHSAESLYYSRSELQARQQLSGKGLGSRLLWGDGAQVLLAELGGYGALHVNCAEAAPVDIDRLHLTLTQQFIGRQHELVASLCKDAFVWPIEDDRVETHDATRGGWEGAAGNESPSTFGTKLANAAMGLLALGLAALLAYLLLVLSGIVRP